MTGNQLAYLELQEKKRNNMVTEGETATHNRNVEQETKRNNLLIARETAKHNRKTEKLKSRELNVSKRNTDVNATTSMRNTDVVTAERYADQANRLVIAREKNATDISINDARNATNKFLKSVDKLIADKRIAAEYRKQLREHAHELKVLNAKNEHDKTEREKDRELKLITDMQGVIYKIGTNIYNAASASKVSPKGTTMYWNTDGTGTLKDNKTGVSIYDVDKNGKIITSADKAKKDKTKSSAVVKQNQKKRGSKKVKAATSSMITTWSSPSSKKSFNAARSRLFQTHIKGGK